MSSKSTVIFLCSVVLVLIVGAFFWFSNLDVDPVMHFSGIGQSLSTDAPHYTYHAKNKVEFGEADPFDDPRWPVFKNSIVSLVAYLVFSLTSVSLISSNAVGVILNLLGLLFFILALWKKHPPLIILIFTICYLINVTLIVHARVPYLENGLIFYVGLLFFMYSIFETKLWNMLVIGGIIAFASFTGKVFGLFLLPAVLVTLYLQNREEKWKSIGIVTLSTIIASALIVFIIYGGNVGNAFGYFSEQSYGLRGLPKIITAPYNIFEYFVTFGSFNRLFYINVDLVLFLLLAAYFLTTQLTTGKKLSSLPPTSLLALLITVIYILFLMSINYSPIRYALLLIPMILIASLGLVKANKQTETNDQSDHLWKNYIGLFFILWLALFHFVVKIFYVNNVPMTMLTYATLPIAGVLVYLLRMSMMKQTSPTNQKTEMRLTFLALILSLVVNGYLINSKLTAEQNYTIKYANEDIAQIIGENAVLSGSYAPLLTLENSHRSFIHQFGIAGDITELFGEYPVTHIAVEASLVPKIKKEYPILHQMIPLSTMWIRDVEIQIFNVSKLFGNEEAKKYVENDFEYGAYYYFNKVPDSAYKYMHRFISEHGIARSSGIILADVHFQTQQYDSAMQVILKVANQYPTDFFVQMHCGQILQAAALVNKDNSLNTLALRYYEKANILNPFEANFIMNTYQQTFKDFGQQPQQQQSN